MQRVVDNVLGIAKESIKVFCQESLNNTLKFINGFSALILTIIPGKTSILEGVHGWELRPSFKAPRLPRWMDDGVSSFNQFIHEYTADSDIDSESEYESGQDDNDSAPPSSPSSQTSYVSRASSFRLERNNSHGSIVKRLISASIWPLRYLFGYSNHSLPTRPSRRKYSLQASISRGGSGSIIGMYDIASKQFMNMKDYVVHHLTDRRRGVIEDIQLLVELFIERVFELLRNALLYIVSPFETFKLVIRKIFFRSRRDAETVTVHATNLGDTNPTPLRVQSSFRQEMNTDARTCEDIVTELGYPYESIRVVTQDGYILQMERIPRRDSQKVLFLQHGLLDSSVGWVSNGVVGSQAFAAYDQGYDVFLGNYRGLASREHMDKNISPQKYWNYSVNELGTQDIPAMLDKLNEIKLSELDVVSSEVEDSKHKQPYTLCGIAHSLGGAVMLMYVVTRRLKGMRHYLSRLILLSPAGFHKEAPLLCNLLQYILPAVDPLLSRIFPGIYIPTKFFRMLFNKLARDFQNYPALGGLVQTLISYILGGDSSNWIEAFGVTHYNMYDMPGVAFRVSVHLSQMKRADRFVMYDFGSASANMKVYGSPHPLDVGSRYDLIDIPVDFVGGLKDKLIPWSMIRRHYHLMKEKGCAVSYTESDYAHLDFIFAHREDLLAYVMSRLLLVKPPSNVKKVKTSYGRSTLRKDSKRLRNSKPSMILQTPKSPPDDVKAVSGVEACECMDSPSLLNPEADQSDEGEISVVH